MKRAFISVKEYNGIIFDLENETILRIGGWKDSTCFRNPFYNMNQPDFQSLLKEWTTGEAFELMEWWE